MATRHSTRGGLSLMSETEINHSPEGHPPEPPGGSGSSSPPEGPRAAPRPKPKIGDTRPAPAVVAPPAPKVLAPVVPLQRPEATAPTDGGPGVADSPRPASDGDSAAKRARSRRRTGSKERKSKQVGRYLVCVHV